MITAANAFAAFYDTQSYNAAASTAAAVLLWD
jgi:hypothetical protein